MADIYDPGDVVRNEITFESAGSPADPATVALEVTDPAGTVSTYTYAGSTVIKTSTGAYRYDLVLGSNAAAGLWRYRWISTGVPATQVRGYFIVRSEPLSEIVRRLRAAMHDRPQRAFLGASLVADAAALTLSQTDSAALFPQTGLQLEFDDGTDEIVITTGRASGADPSTVPIARGQDGTAGQPHASGTPILVGADFTRAEILGAANEIVDLELYPHVWEAGELVFTPASPSDEMYPLTVPGVAEIVGAYQVQSGTFYRVSVVHLTSAAANDQLYPGGALRIHDCLWGSPLYVSYRSQPALGSLNAELSSLVTAGVRWKLLESTEAQKSLRSTDFVRSQSPGTSLRASIVAKSTFEDARARLNVKLQLDEGRRGVDLGRVR